MQTLEHKALAQTARPQFKERQQSMAPFHPSHRCIRAVSASDRSSIGVTGPCSSQACNDFRSWPSSGSKMTKSSTLGFKWTSLNSSSRLAHFPLRSSPHQALRTTPDERPRPALTEVDHPYRVRLTTQTVQHVIASTVQLYGDPPGVCEFKRSAYCSILEKLGSELEYAAQRSA